MCNDPITVCRDLCHWVCIVISLLLVSHAISNSSKRNLMFQPLSYCLVAYGIAHLSRPAVHQGAHAGIMQDLCIVVKLLILQKS